MLRLLLVCLLLPAGAAASDDASPDLLLVAPDGDAARAKRLARKPVGDARVLSDVVEEAVGRGARLYGASEIGLCEASPLPRAELEAIVQSADEALLELDWAEAATVLRDAAEQLPCVDYVVPREPLSDLFFLLGVAESYAGAEASAQRWFGQALAVSPERSFDQDLAPNVYRQYLVAMERHYASEPVPVALLLGDEPVTVTIDGVAPDAQGHAIGAGYHFLQLTEPSGAVTTFEFRVEPGDRLAVTTPAGALATASLGPAAPLAVRDVVAAVLGGAASATGHEAVQYATDEVIWRYIPSEQRFETIWEAPDPRERLRAAGTGMVLGGLGTATAGLILSGVSFLTAPEHPTHPDYPGALIGHRVGIGIAAAGATLAIAGVPLLVAGRKPAVVAVSVGPEHVTFGLAGVF